MLVCGGTTVHRDSGFLKHALLDCDASPPCAPVPRMAVLGKVRVISVHWGQHSLLLSATL